MQTATRLHSFINGMVQVHRVMIFTSTFLLMERHITLPLSLTFATRIQMYIRLLRDLKLARQWILKDSFTGIRELTLTSQK